MAAPGIVGTATGGRVGSGSFAVTPPAGSAYFIAFLMGASTGGFTAPAGWTLVGDHASDQLHVYTSTEASPGTSWSKTTGTAPISALVVGFDALVEFDNTMSFAATSTSPSVTASDDALAMRVWADQPDSTDDVTYPTGSTLGRAQANQPDGTNTWSNIVAVAFDVVAAGSTGTAAWSHPAPFAAHASTVVLLGVAAPEPPAGLSATPGVKSVSVSYDPVGGADGYVIGWRRTDLVRPSVTTQTSAPWQLDIIDDAAGLDGSYGYDFDGSGVIVYSCDTGVLYSHNDLEGRTNPGVNLVLDAGDYDEPTDGHGTGGASIAIGVGYGAAKGASVTSVRVGSLAGWDGVSPVPLNILEGMRDWILANHPPGTPGVVNNSLPGRMPVDAGHAEEAAIWQDLLDAGLCLTVAAGNDNIDRSTETPQNLPAAIAVAGSTNADAKWANSCFGSNIAIWSPSFEVVVADYTSNTATRTTSGTSYGSPLVAGVVAKILQANPNMSPARAREVIHTQGLPVVTGVPAGTTDRRLNSSCNSDDWSDHETVLTSTVLDGLEPGAAYEVRVASVFDGVRSDWSTPVAVVGGRTTLGTRAVTGIFVGDRQVVGIQLGTRLIL